ncbi:MAG: SDR family oxidoreductase [Bacteroidaceae bacterium]|nr:SDR family oxidoreductase [Bacteroidaceae bacterium]
MSFNPFSLEGKTILVTGASSGIGQGVAVACSKMGAKLLINGRDHNRLKATMVKLEGEGHKMIPADLTDIKSVSGLIESLPPLDGVVHCAGIGQRILCRLATERDVDIVMDTNFKAPVLLQTELIKQKKINKGASIVFIASISTWSPSIGNAFYSASKGAIVSYANCLALELAPRRVRVNCISPAMVWTDLILQEGVEEEQLKADEQKYPLKRYGTPEDVANLAIYMLSDASSWMTGSNVKLSGGGN